MVGDRQLVCFQLKYRRSNFFFCANSFAGCVFVLKIGPDTRKSVKWSQIFLSGRLVGLESRAHRIAIHTRQFAPRQIAARKLAFIKDT